MLCAVAPDMVRLSASALRGAGREKVRVVGMRGVA